MYISVWDEARFRCECYDENLRNWARGVTHVTPPQCNPATDRWTRFLTETAYSLRMRTFIERILSGDDSIQEWPEAVKVAGGLQIRVDEVDFSTMLEHVALPTFLQEPGKTASAKRRRRWKKAIHKWQYSRRCERGIEELVLSLLRK